MSGEELNSFSEFSEAATKVLADGVEFGRAKVNFNFSDPGKRFSINSGCAVATDSSNASHSINSSFPYIDVGHGKRFGYSSGYVSDANAKTKSLALETATAGGTVLKGNLSTREFCNVYSFQVAMAAKHKNYHGTLGLDVEVGQKCTGFSGSYAHKLGPCLFGGQVAYDHPSMSCPDRQLGVSYLEEDFTATAAFNMGTDFQGYRLSLHQHVSERIQCAAQLIRNFGSSSTAMTLATDYSINDVSSCKIKLDNGSDVAVSYKRQLEPGVSLSAGALFGLQRLSQPAIHRIGVSLSFEAEGTPDYLLTMMRGLL